MEITTFNIIGLTEYMVTTVVWAHLIALITKQMSTTDGAIKKKMVLWFGMDKSLSTSENSYANETSAINKILFITFSTN